MISADEIRRVYRLDVLAYADVGIRVSDPSMMLWLERMFTCFGDVSGKRAIDFGAASGHKAMLLARLGANVVAFDMAEESIVRMKHAREISGIDFKIVKGGSEYLAESDEGTFDLMLCGEIIEHIPPSETEGFLASANRVLNSQGKLFITTPNVDVYGPAEQASEYIGRTSFGHYKHYSLDELTEVLKQASFRICNSWYECHPLTRWRNRIFYPLAQYDNALYTSKRLAMIRYVLRPLSFLFHLVMEFMYPVTYYIQRRYELRRAHISSGMTIMVDVMKIDAGATK
jgi:2-polyprenyl-3-methyl-5-hydroxy-6-metoxy-1,4-benzoquinol methylase